MVYKGKQTWKDLIEKPEHISMSRRDLLARGLATSVLSFALPLPLSLFMRKAQAQGVSLNCPPTTRSVGAIGQIFAQGGPTMGARFIGEDQAALMNTTIAANYGITGTNLLKLGSNLVIDTTSPFGATLMQGPNGFTGGAAAWQSTVLNKISGGGHRGPFNADDGAGINTGLMGGVAPFKGTQLNKDLHISVSNTMASWAQGIANVSIAQNSLSPTGLSNLFAVTPGVSGLATAQTFTDAANTATNLASALGSVFNNGNRNGSTTLASSAGCALNSNASLANPTFGSSLFVPSGISALSSQMTISALSAEEQSLLAAYYQSAQGVIGGVVLELGGRDYHGQSPQTVIAPADIEEARALVMFLAACNAAQTPGAFLYFANGQAIASGVQSVTTTIGGVAATVNAPVAKGDAGGSYNAGLVIFYDPNGSPPAAQFTGTISSSSGNAKIASTVSSSAAAVSGLYLSALKWINGGTVPQSALTAMNITNTTGIMVI